MATTTTSDLSKGKSIVLMGVSGCGKSTIGSMLAKVVDCSSFIDADDFHTQANKEKMQQGIPITHEDRMPWLQLLRNVLRESLLSGKTVILACSSLKKEYREILRSADPNYQPAGGTTTNAYATCMVKFIFLDAGAQVIAARLQNRAAQGTHFVPPTLLQSQFDLLQIDDCEGILKVDATPTAQLIVSKIQSLLPSLLSQD